MCRQFCHQWSSYYLTRDEGLGTWYHTFKKWYFQNWWKLTTNLKYVDFNTLKNHTFESVFASTHDHILLHSKSHWYSQSRYIERTLKNKASNSKSWIIWITRSRKFSSPQLYGLWNCKDFISNKNLNILINCAWQISSIQVLWG